MRPVFFILGCLLLAAACFSGTIFFDMSGALLIFGLCPLQLALFIAADNLGLIGNGSEPKRRRIDRNRRTIVYLYEFPDGTYYIGITSQLDGRRWTEGHYNELVESRRERFGITSPTIIADDMTRAAAFRFESRLIAKFADDPNCLNLAGATPRQQRAKFRVAS